MTLAISTTMRALLTAGLLIVVVVGAVLVLAMVRRRLLRSAEQESSAPLSLHEIRAMRKNNQITEEEFEQLRHVALAGWGVSASSGSSTADPNIGDMRTANPGRTENFPPAAFDEDP